MAFAQVAPAQTITYNFKASGGANETYTGKIVLTGTGGKIWFDQLQTWTDLQNITFDSNTSTLSFIRPTSYGSQQWTGVISGNQISGKANGYIYTGIEEVTSQVGLDVTSIFQKIPSWGWIAIAGIGAVILFGGKLFGEGKKKD